MVGPGRSLAEPSLRASVCPPRRAAASSCALPCTRFSDGTNPNSLSSATGSVALIPRAGANVVQHVHEVDVAVVGALIRAEILVDVAVGPVFGAHVVEVVGGGQLAPVGQQKWVGLFLDHAFELVKLVQGVGLHGVAKPGGQIA